MYQLNPCDMRKFRSSEYSSSERVLDALEAVKLTFRKIEAERVAVVEFGINKSSGDGTGSFEVQFATYAVSAPLESSEGRIRRRSRIKIFVL